MAQTNTKTHWKKVKGTNYLGEWSVPDNEELVLSIKSVGKELVPNAQGKSDEKYVIHFDEVSEGLVVSAKVVLQAIAEATGSPYIEDWVGHKITLYKEFGHWFGKAQHALRVRPEAPSEEKLFCDECGQEIKPASGMNAAKIAEYTKKKYGKQLCSECAMKEKEAANGADK